MAIVELHVHGRPHKHGGNAKLMEIARIAKSQGTDCLVLTEHDHTKDYRAWTEKLIDEVRQKHQIQILVGAERTHKKFGHYLDYGKNVYGRSLFVWAHPLDKFRHLSVDDIHEARQMFIAIEVANKRYNIGECMELLRYANAFNFRISAGSDIHLNRHVGLCRCYIQTVNPTMKMIDVHSALLDGRVFPIGFPK